MTETEQLAVIAEALQSLPPEDRDDLMGEAFLTLTTVMDRPRAAQVLAIRRHAEYIRRRDGRPQAGALPELGADDPSLAAVDLRDELSRLSPTDRSICTMILAGYTHREIGASLALSPATIGRRLRALRGAP